MSHHNSLVTCIFNLIILVDSSSAHHPITLSSLLINMSHSCLQLVHSHVTNLSTLKLFSAHQRCSITYHVINHFFNLSLYCHTVHQSFHYHVISQLLQSNLQVCSCFAHVICSPVALIRDSSNLH